MFRAENSKLYEKLVPIISYLVWQIVAIILEGWNSIILKVDLVRISGFKDPLLLEADRTNKWMCSLMSNCYKNLVAYYFKHKTSQHLSSQMLFIRNIYTLYTSRYVQLSHFNFVQHWIRNKCILQYIITNTGVVPVNNNNKRLVRHVCVCLPLLHPWWVTPTALN